MKRKISILSFYSLLFFLAMGIVSCEKPIIDERTGNENPAEATLGVPAISGWAIPTKAQMKRPGPPPIRRTAIASVPSPWCR